MKKKILGLVTIITLSFALIACGGTDNTENNTNATDKEETDVTEKHEHAYAEEITTPATCEADGVKTYNCECGDNYTEVITATGHIFEAYASNNDATYTADGTETSKCSNCDVTDTRTAEGSMLTYTYTDMDATMYVQETVNVRNLPNTDGEKLGGLNQNDEVHVTGQCAETSWYRIEYSGGVAYVSNSYLGTEKVSVQSATEPSQSPASEDVLVDQWGFYNANWIEQQWWFENLNQVVDDGNGKAYMYASTNGAYWSTKGNPADAKSNFENALYSSGATNISHTAYEAVDALSSTANKERGLMFDINYFEWTYTPAP